MSAVLRLRHTIGADRLHFSLCVNPHQVRCAAYLLRPHSGSPEPYGIDMQEFYIWQMLEHDAAIQLHLAPSRQEGKHRNNKQHPLLFKIKHSLQYTNLKEETNTSPSTNPSVRNTLCCWFYNTEL